MTEGEQERGEPMHHLGYSSEDLLQDGVGLCFLWPVGLDLQAHRTWLCNKPVSKKIRTPFCQNRGSIIVVNYRGH